MESLPPGFRFYPTEEELISFYLHSKLEGRRQDIDTVIPVVDIYDQKPWDLPQFAGECCRGDPEQWFFFIPMQDREARGGRPNRLTTEGYWKATGSPGCVYSSQNRIIGMKRTMVFYKGRAPNGEKTQWKMNEYKAIDGEASSAAPPKLRQEMSLCRVYIGSKSLRAFDRRPPPPPGETMAHHRQPHHQEDQPATITSHQTHPPPLAAERASSSSGSGEENLPASSSHGMENESHDFAINPEPMWDWEQLNWF